MARTFEDLPGGARLSLGVGTALFVDEPKHQLGPAAKRAKFSQNPRVLGSFRNGSELARRSEWLAAVRAGYQLALDEDCPGVGLNGRRLAGRATQRALGAAGLAILQLWAAVAKARFEDDAKAGALLLRVQGTGRAMPSAYLA